MPQLFGASEWRLWTERMFRNVLGAQRSSWTNASLVARSSWDPEAECLQAGPREVTGAPAEPWLKGRLPSGTWTAWQVRGNPDHGPAARLWVDRDLGPWEGRGAGSHGRKPLGEAQAEQAVA